MQNQIPKNWQKVKLGVLLKSGAILEVQDGNHGEKHPKQSDYVKEGDRVPFIMANDLSLGTIDFKNCSYIKKDQADKLRIGFSKTDDVLLTHKGNLGLVSIVPKMPFDYIMLTPQVTYYRTDKNRLYSEFLKYAFLNPAFQKDLLNISPQSTRPYVGITAQRDLEIYFTPDIKTQEKIAETLAAFDEKIEINNKSSKTLEGIAQALFKEWFIKGSKLKVKSKKLSNLVNTQYGYTESASEKEIGPKFLRVMDINKTNWIDWSSVPYCKISDVELPKYRLKKGDVVIARMADPGKVAIVEEDVNAVFASYLIRLQIISDVITPYFLFYYLRSHLYQNFIFGASTGTTRNSANARVITDVELAVPPKEKILEFEYLASTIRSKVLSSVKENQKLAALRNLLLPKLMKGEIRV